MHYWPEGSNGGIRKPVQRSEQLPGPNHIYAIHPLDVGVRHKGDRGKMDYMVGPHLLDDRTSRAKVRQITFVEMRDARKLTAVVAVD